MSKNKKILVISSILVGLFSAVNINAMQINSQKNRYSPTNSSNEFLFSSGIKQFKQLQENINKELEQLNEKIKSIIETNYETYNLKEKKEAINSLSKIENKLKNFIEFEISNNGEIIKSYDYMKRFENTEGFENIIKLSKKAMSFLTNTQEKFEKIIEKIKELIENKNNKFENNFIKKELENLYNKLTDPNYEFDSFLDVINQKGDCDNFDGEVNYINPEYAFYKLKQKEPEENYDIELKNVEETYTPDDSEEIEEYEHLLNLIEKKCNNTDLERMKEIVKNSYNELINIEKNFQAHDSKELNEYKEWLILIKDNIKKSTKFEKKHNDIELKNKILELNKKYKHIENLIEIVESENSNITNKKPSYNKILEDIQKISYKNGEDEINKAEKDLDLIESFIKYYSKKFKNKIQNIKLLGAIENLSCIFKDSKYHLNVVKEIIKKLKENNELIENYEKELEDIENNYEKVTMNQTKDYQKFLFDLKTNLEKIYVFANITKNNELKEKIEKIQKRIVELKFKKEINEINKQISSYDDVLNNIQKIPVKDGKDVEDKINEAKKDLDLIKSFVENSTKIANEIKNYHMLSQLDDLSTKINETKENLEFKIRIITDTKTKENSFNVYKKELDNIENNYKNADIEQIENYKNRLSEIKINLETIYKFTSKLINKELRIKELRIKIKKELKKIENIYNYLETRKNVDKLNEKTQPTYENNNSNIKSQPNNISNTILTKKDTKK